MSEGNETQRRERGAEAFFGRRRGKPVRDAARLATGRMLPERLLDLSRPAPADLRTLFSAPIEGVRMEIGFGAGEHLLTEAKRETDTGFIGVEPFVNGMSRFLHALDSEPLPNIRIYDDDAVRVLDWLPEASLDAIDLLYPDPWPKRKHWKRRFVSQTNLTRLARALKPGGRFCFASDIDHYVNWTLLMTGSHPAFSWQAGQASDWLMPYAHWRPTRYEEKAVREGRRTAYLTFLRREA